MMGAWAARADGSGVKSLYDPVGSGDELLIGRLDARTSWSIPGTHNVNKALRTFNIETGAVGILLEECLSYVAIDANGGRLLAAHLGKDGPGSWLLLIEPGAKPVQPVVADEPRGVRRSTQAQGFLALTEFDVLAVSPTGDVIELAVPQGATGIPALSPEGSGLAWTGSGLWVGSLANSHDRPPRQVFSEPMSLATWDPEGEYPLFFSHGGFYVGRSPDFEPLLIAEGMIGAKETGWFRR